MLTGLTPPEETGLPLGLLERAVRLDPQHRDLVAAGVDGEQVVGALLDRALRGERMAWAGTADRERRAGERRQRPVGVPVESADGVHAGRVVVDVDLPERGQGLRVVLRGRAANNGEHGGRREQPEGHQAKLPHSNLPNTGRGSFPARRPPCRAALSGLFRPGELLLNSQRRTSRRRSPHTRSRVGGDEMVNLRCRFSRSESDALHDRGAELRMAFWNLQPTTPGYPASQPPNLRAPRDRSIRIFFVSIGIS